MLTTGDRIREIREKKKMTQEQLAKVAGLSKGFLSEIESNNKNVSSQNLLRIANALEASLDYLLRGEIKVAEEKKSILIPAELSKIAEELNISYSETLELLDTYNSVVARRTNREHKPFLAEDWKKLYKKIKEVFD